MKNIKNPDAFPSDNKNEGYAGMGLRDYFAAKAMQAIINNTVDASGFGKPLEFVTKCAYNIADGMLKERDNEAI